MESTFVLLAGFVSRWHRIHKTKSTARDIEMIQMMHQKTEINASQLKIYHNLKAHDLEP